MIPIFNNLVCDLFQSSDFFAFKVLSSNIYLHQRKTCVRQDIVISTAVAKNETSEWLLTENLNTVWTISLKNLFPETRKNPLGIFVAYFGLKTLYWIRLYVDKKRNCPSS